MSKYIAFYIIYVICYTQLMPITWRIVVKICLNPCHAPDGIVAAALYRGQGTAAAAIRPTTIKLDQEHSHQISTGGPPSYSHQQLSLGQCCQKYQFEKCGDQFSASSDYNCADIDLNDEKSARKERFWKYLQATSVQRRPCLGAVMMSLCHTEASCP